MMTASFVDGLALHMNGRSESSVSAAREEIICNNSNARGGVKAVMSLLRSSDRVYVAFAMDDL